MRSRFYLLVLIALLASTALAAKPRVHVISFGKSLPVKLFIGPGEDRTVPMNVRALLVDGTSKEFTTGELHTVTDRIFIIRRAFRVNDNLPGEQGRMPRWVWQRGSWLMVDRVTARITQLNLPLFDPFYSQASWFRDYAAYCGISDNGEKLYTVVLQLGRKKAVLRQEIGATSQGDEPDSDCTAPTWEKNPVRVTFHPKRGQPSSFTVRGRSVDMAPGSSEDEE
jgi:hypothetical protein